MTKRERIALFGGSFDPPHRAHIELLQQVQDSYSFDRIWVVPSKYPPGKTPIASYEKRLDWCRRIFQIPYCVVSDLEAGASQSVFGSDIFSKIALERPEAEYYWILGSDQFEQLPYWKGIDNYASSLTWIVLFREKQKPQSSRQLRSRRLQRTTCAYEWAAIQPMPGVSSTQVREECLEDTSLLNQIPDTIREEVRLAYQQQKGKG